jgi:hypothetical protein
MKSGIADISVLRYGIITERKEHNIVEFIEIPTAPDRKNRRWLYVEYSVCVTGVELLDITERWNGLRFSQDYIVNYKRSGDSSQLHRHEIFKQRYLTHDEWVEKTVGVSR